MKYSDLDRAAVEAAADIRDLIPDLKGTGATRYCKCPNCGASGKNKGLQVWHKKKGNTYVNGSKCHQCGHSMGGAISAYMELRGVKFLTALEDLAKEYNVNITPLDNRKSGAGSSGSARNSFCEMQLFASGLTFDDVTVRVPVKGSDDFRLESPFRKGGADRGVRHLNESDDEMLIYYYDLDGNPMKFSERGGKGTLRPYVRVRWSNPDLHQDAEGKGIKYQSPKGAPCAFYIPERIRQAYRESEHIETLVIQEGEKKAEKACKHGILSLGIQGIYNIGNAESGLIKELQYIVRKCDVKNVVLLMDSDWDHLSKDLQSGSRIDQRPNQFAKAVIKFKQYVNTLHKLGLSVDVWFGHINENERGDKGIDDLLVGTLLMHEEELARDFGEAMYSHDGVGRYVSVHKITSRTDNQIMDFWHLNSRKEFFEKYHDSIDGLVTFRFGGIVYVVEDGKFKEAARGGDESNFWTVSVNEKDRKSVEFGYLAALNFLSANSFFKIRTVDLKPGEFRLVKVDDFVVSETSGPEIRDFVYDYVLKSTKDVTVLDSFIARLNNWLGIDKLERLPELEDNFNDMFILQYMTQNYFYRDVKVSVSSAGIQCDNIAEYVWKENRIDRKFKRVPVFSFMEKYEDGTFGLDFTEEGKRCEFIQFLINTSNFWKGRESSMTREDHEMFWQHIVNKITSIGYLLTSWKPRSEQICIVAMDAKMDEVGASNGRSGKSMIGLALQQVMNVQTIDCKKMKNDDDFIYSLVTPKTRLIFLDDTRVNFDFENFYSALTGDLQINPKQGGRFEIKYERAPKFYLTTNHAINDQSDSGKDRRVLMAFSNYFSSSFSPSDYFGHMLFDDWDAEQWNLFDNLMMECIMFYLRSREQGWTRRGRGVVPPPMAQLERRALRQTMGEAFLMWAEALFDPENHVINYKIGRKELVDKFHSEFSSARESIRAADFRKRMIAFCRFKGYHFNPNMKNQEGERFSDWRQTHEGETFVGEPYKSNSVEYWTVATDEFSKVQPW